MPRASRNFLPDHVRHLTHRCHKKDFLLKFAIDRQAWVGWPYEAQKRYGLCILNYVATSNHIHLPVKDIGRGEIPGSMQLVAGGVAQEYNQRKSRRGAFWEDRYHATAVAADHHLVRCLTYIDLNMIRAWGVKDPADWSESGFAELMHPRKWYHLLDHGALADLLGVAEAEEMRAQRRMWVDEAILREALERDPCWSESLAVGGEECAQGVKTGPTPSTPSTTRQPAGSYQLKPKGGTNGDFNDAKK